MVLGLRNGVLIRNDRRGYLLYNTWRQGAEKERLGMHNIMGTNYLDLSV